MIDIINRLHINGIGSYWCLVCKCSIIEQILTFVNMWSLSLGDGRAYKGVPDMLTCRRSGHICKIITLCIFYLKFGGGGQLHWLYHPWLLINMSCWTIFFNHPYAWKEQGKRLRKMRSSEHWTNIHNGHSRQITALPLQISLLLLAFTINLHQSQTF